MMHLYEVCFLLWNYIYIYIILKLLITHDVLNILCSFSPLLWKKSFIHIERSLMSNEPDNVDTGFLIVLLEMNKVIERNIE